MAKPWIAEPSSRLVNQADKQLVAQLSARIAPDTKVPTLTIQLPLGISLSDPVQLKVDNGRPSSVTRCRLAPMPAASSPYR